MEAAAHKPHGRKHRGREVLLDLNTTRTGLPFLLRREREMYLASMPDRTKQERLLKRLEANIMRCNTKAVGRVLGEILRNKDCTPEQVADACNRAIAKLRESGKRKEAFLMGAAIYRLTITGLLKTGEYRAAGSGQTKGDEDLSRTNDVVAECFRERMFPNRTGGRP